MIEIKTDLILMYLDKENNELLTPNQMLQMFDDYVDEMDGKLEILGMTYLKSKALAELDPIAYDLESGCFIDNLVHEDDSFDELMLNDDEIKRWG